MLHKPYTFLKVLIIIVLLVPFTGFSVQSQDKSPEVIITAIKNASSKESETHELSLLNLDLMSWYLCLKASLEFVVNDIEILLNKYR